MALKKKYLKSSVFLQTMLEENWYKWYNRSKSDHNSSMLSEGAEWFCTAVNRGVWTGFPAAAGRKASICVSSLPWLGPPEVSKDFCPRGPHAQAPSRLRKSSAGRGVGPGRGTPLAGANPKPRFYEQREYSLCCPTMYIRGWKTALTHPTYHRATTGRNSQQGCKGRRQPSSL